MIPTRRLVLVALVPLVLGVVAAWVPAAVAPMLAADLLLVLLAAIDLGLNRGRVTASRALPQVQAVGSTFPVELTIGNVGARDLDLRVTDDAPGVASGLPAAFWLRAGTRTVITYRVRVDGRGEQRFGAVTVRWRSPLGLLERQVRLEVPGSVRIYPAFTQLRSHGLRARQDEQRLPVRIRRRPGGENEFERLRPYVPGDPYKHIDWKATARRREFTTREFGQESNQNVIFLLDCGRMMSARSGDLTAFDHALNAALMMGQTALRHGDRVGLLAFDSRIRTWIPPKGGARSGARLIRGTYDLFPTLEEPDHALAFRHLAQRVKRRSLVVLMTSVVDDVNAELTTTLLGAMAGRHLPLCVWIRDLDVETALSAPAESAEDRWARCAAAGIVAWRERSLAALQRRGALVVDCNPLELTPNLLGRYLEVKAARLL